MAPVPARPNYTPLAVSATHFLLTIYLTFAIARSLYRSYLQLPPAQETRSRHSRRKHVVPVFATLAVASLAQAAYTAVRYMMLSYKAWAHCNSTGVPIVFWGNKGIFDLSEGSALDYISRWLADTSIYRDAFEIISERSRRFWWGQQFDLALLSWTLLLAIEGRRRNIPFTWAYLGLAHLVSLSLAQNLFYMALLLTPSPMPPGPGGGLPASRYVEMRDRVFPPKPRNWHPHPSLYIIPYTISATTIFLTPLFTQSPLLTPLVWLTRLSTFATLVIPRVVPESWGTVYSHPHNAYGSFSKLFRYLSFLSAALHGKATLSSLLSGRADDYRNKHSPFMDSDPEKRDEWSRILLPFGRIYEAASDHPVVSGVSRDVLLSTVSMGLWAAIRGISADDILSSTVPFYERFVQAPEYDPNDPHDARALLAKAEAEMEAEAEAEAKVEVEDDTISVATAESSGTAATASSQRRKRGRPSKNSKADENALTTATPTPRKRGRPRKDSGPSEAYPYHEDGEAGEAEDPTYQPSPSVRAALVEGDEAMYAVGDMEWESAALAWGLAAVGGLGCGSAGVFGGECVSR